MMVTNIDKVNRMSSDTKKNMSHNVSWSVHILLVGAGASIHKGSFHLKNCSIDWGSFQLMRCIMLVCTGKHCLHSNSVNCCVIHTLVANFFTGDSKGGDH